MSTLELPDIQQTAPTHAIAINWVGVRGLRYPVHLALTSAPQGTVGEFSLAVGLGPNERGTHMSRFVEELASLRHDLSPTAVLNAARSLALRLQSASARIDTSFPFFLDRQAPASMASAPVDYEGRLSAIVRRSASELRLSVRVPVTSLCPCSKEISDYGAHSQRGYVLIEVAAGGDRLPGLLGLELPDLVEVAERAASAPIYALLKRTDERLVTMQAYDQPAFVEDVVRAVADELSADSRIESFLVDVENQESIHNHAAWARIGR